jgi:hypothetical protein
MLKQAASEISHINNALVIVILIGPFREYPDLLGFPANDQQRPKHDKEETSFHSTAVFSVIKKAARTFRAAFPALRKILRYP